MSRKFKSIGLVLIVVCAFGAVSAGAAQAANWKMAGSAFTGTETVSVIPKGAVRLTIPSFGTTISCTGLSAPGATIFGGNKDSTSSLEFTGCTVVDLPGCEVLNLGGTGGTINTPGVTGELKTIGGVAYDIVSPASGSELFTMVIRKTATGSCSLATGAAGVKVAGRIGLQVATGEAVSLKQTASQAIGIASGAHLTYGNNPMYLEGEIESTLTGANKGKVWGVTL